LGGMGGCRVGVEGWGAVRKEGGVKASGVVTIVSMIGRVNEHRRRREGRESRMLFRWGISTCGGGGNGSAQREKRGKYAKAQSGWHLYSFYRGGSCQERGEKGTLGERNKKDLVSIKVREKWSELNWSERNKSRGGMLHLFLS